MIQQSQSGGHAVAPKLAEFEYNRASQLTDLYRYSATAASTSDLQVHTRMDYDGAGRLSSLTHGASEIASGENWNGTSTLPASLGSSDLLAAYTFQYDADNRLTQFSTYRDGTSTAYGYDVRDQLTSAASTAISGLSQPFGLASAESYDFDAGGNRKSSGAGEDNGTEKITGRGLNRLVHLPILGARSRAAIESYQCHVKIEMTVPVKSIML